MTYVKGKFYPDPTPERLARERPQPAERPTQDERVPWQVNADIIRQMKEE